MAVRVVIDNLEPEDITPELFRWLIDLWADPRRPPRTTLRIEHTSEPDHDAT